MISANKGVDPENASSELLVQSIEILQDPETTFRFDGSDLMPGAVGADSFWKGIVAWVGGESTAAGARHHRVDLAGQLTIRASRPGASGTRHDRGAGLKDPAPRHPSFNDEPGRHDDHGRSPRQDPAGGDGARGVRRGRRPPHLLHRQGPEEGPRLLAAGGVPRSGVDPRRDRPRLPGDPHEHPGLPGLVGRLDPRQLRLDVHAARRDPHAHQHRHLGAARADVRDRGRPRLRRVHRQVTRREVLQGDPVHADRHLVRGRERHLEVRLRVPLGRSRADRPPQRDRRRVRR